LAGCDEVGRGPLAGPVVACCVFLDLKKGTDHFKILEQLKNWGVTDSKKLSEVKRETILQHLSLKNLVSNKNCAIGGTIFEPLVFRVEEISVLEIDQLNILNASLLAMEKAYLGLLGDRSHSDGTLLIDGNKTLKGNRGIPIIKGDTKSLLIGLASIIAKVYRDRLMKDFGVMYPHYGFEKNAGYPTEKHRKALLEKGPCPIHRKTFKGVSEYFQRAE